MSCVGVLEEVSGRTREILINGDYVSYNKLVYLFDLESLKNNSWVDCFDKMKLGFYAEHISEPNMIIHYYDNKIHFKDGRSAIHVDLFVESFSDVLLNSGWNLKSLYKL